MQKLTSFLFVSVFLLAGMAQAAVPRISSTFKKQGQYLTEGVFTGGKAGKGFSILDIRRKLSKKTKRDRWVVEIGDVYLKPMTRDVPYFHVAVSEDPARITIDLYQVHRSKLNENAIREILTKSPYVRDVSMIYNSVEGGMNFVVSLVRPANVEVFKMPANTKSSRLVIDIVPST